MTFRSLRITGPNKRPYVLGEPIDVYDGNEHVGTLLSVSVSANGNEVRLEDFLTASLPDFRSKGIATLVTAEIVTFISERFPSVHAIGIVLSREIEGFETRGNKLASFRSDMLRSIGADGIRVTPKPHAEHAGHFVVSGIWQYNRANVEALAAVLERERAAYRERKLATAEAQKQRSVLGRLFTRN
ncbi:hypothetical protein QTI66_22345 [Variovorax sp. J22R133]|uniref:hypothetical protein n=1 Tax=Variovorax brevis TaxID=3053503 RepID=UPI0025781D87|nr:hypothetical protein [Variovorax sp. J22R133]MDM0114907.1 hypothetical protein [Variovorax sp. J22R133]